MKILSKYKDYYDYLAGIYGEDEKLILDRRDGNAKNILGRVVTLYLCDNKIEGYNINNKFYWGKDEIDKIATPMGESTYFMSRNLYTHYIKEPYRKSYRSVDYINCNLIKDVKLTNTKLNCPILIKGLINDKLIKFPKLETLGIQTIIKPFDIWIMLSEWLGYMITQNEPSVPIGDDKIRVESHGFDLKTSFRHRK